MKSSYTPYTDLIYRLDGYIISDIQEATYPEFEIFHNVDSNAKFPHENN